MVTDADTTHILKALMRDVCSRGGAIFFSTHVLEVAEKLCDKIAVFSGGNIVEYGCHDELMEHNGMYAEFFNLQSQYYL